MLRSRVFAVVLALSGCAPAATVRPAVPAAPVAAAPAADAEARTRLEARVHELETQLALARAQARDLNERLAERDREERAHVTRIGPGREAVEAPERVAEREDRSPRPVLRLYGPTPEPIPGPPPPIIAEAPPIGGAPRLDVVMLPGALPEDGVPAIPTAPVPVAPRLAPLPAHADPDPAADRYRHALEAMSSRRFDEALEGFEAFLRLAPDHAYADNALFWSGEIHFARRDYARSLEDMQRLVARYPHGNKVPDALLRIGVCYARMGDHARARAAFDELRARFPQSVAARMAAQEDA